MYIPQRIKHKLFFIYIVIVALAGVVIWTAAADVGDSLLHLYALNVGQGDAIYLRLPSGHDLLFDGGPGEGVLSQLGEVMPFNDREIDLVIATHNHADHIGGLDDVLDRYEVKEIWLTGAVHDTKTYSNWFKSVKQEEQQGAKVVEVSSGVTKQFGEITLSTLHPPDDFKGKTPKDQHDATIVTKVSFRDFDALLTGDLNEEHEQKILDFQSQILDSEVMKVPHHGSASGLSEQFLDSVKPKLAIISVGKGNQFGHPAPSILRKLREHQVETYRTDEQGRIELVSDGERYSAKTEHKPK